MGQEGRDDETERKQEKDHRQSRPVLEGRNAKEMQRGRVGKVMAEEKNRQGDENEEGNKNKTS
jgi:hypothetical protein